MDETPLTAGAARALSKRRQAAAMPKVLYPPSNIIVHNIRWNEINPVVTARILQD
jgi:hypothetical protein